MDFGFTVYKLGSSKRLEDACQTETLINNFLVNNSLINNSLVIVVYRYFFDADLWNPSDKTFIRRSVDTCRTQNFSLIKANAKSLFLFLLQNLAL